MILVTNEIYLVWELIGNNEPVDIKLENDMTQTTGVIWRISGGEMTEITR